MDRNKSPLVNVKELREIAGPLNDMAGQMRVGAALMKAGMFMKVFPVVVIFVMVMWVYMKFFYAKRMRGASLSIMIELEPEIQFFSERIAGFVASYNLNAQDRFAYAPDVTNNLYFYKALANNTIGDAMGVINTQLLPANGVEFKSDKYEEYEDTVAKFVNTRFRWSKAEKFDRNQTNRYNNDRLFDQLVAMAGVQESFDGFMGGRSLFNYLDFDHMALDAVGSNRLFRKYGRVLPAKEGLIAYVEPILEETEGKGSDYKSVVETMRGQIENNSTLFRKEENARSLNRTIMDLLRDARSLIARVLSAHNGVTEDDYVALVDLGEGERDFTLAHKACKKEGDEKEERELSELTDEERGELMRHLRMVKMMDDLIKLIKDNLVNGHLVLNQLKEHFIFVEKIVYEEFHPETHKALFDTYQQMEVVTKYQSAIDYAYLKAYPRAVEEAVKFTLYFMLDRDKRKEERLERLAELYVAFNDVFVVQEYRRRLDSYDNSRNPDLKNLRKLYQDTLTNYYKYYLKENIIDQWTALYSGKRPGRYAWTLDWLRDLIGGKSIDDIVFIIFPDIDKGAGEVIDDVFEGVEDIAGKSLNYLKYATPGYWIGNVPVVGDALKNIPVLGGLFGGGGIDWMKKMAERIFKLLKALTKLVAYLLQVITKPKETLKFVTRGLLLIVAIAVKIGFYLFKMNDVYLLGEFVLYNLVVCFFTIANAVVWVFLTVYTSIIMFVDLTLFKGWIYRFLYWGFGASENSPRAWYLRSGYHYGAHNQNTRYKNMVKRMVLAYNACPDDYKPDRKTFGLMCTRKYRQEPGYCLQANINRVREDMPYRTPYLPDAFMPDMNFFDAKRGKRNRIVKEFKTMKKRFFANCDSAMHDYDALTKNICRMYPEATAPSRHRALRSLCYNAYCTNGKNEAFCYKFGGDTLDPTSAQLGGGSNVYTRMSVLSAYVVVLTYIITTMISKRFDANWA